MGEHFETSREVVYTVVLAPRDDGPKAVYGHVDLICWSDGTVSWEADE